MPLVYDEPHRLAEGPFRRGDLTIQPTAVVLEPCPTLPWAACASEWTGSPTWRSRA